MLDFLKSAFIKKKEVNPEPDNEDEQQYIEYCKALEKTLRVLEAHLHESDDPVEIAQNTMKAACDFYGADWCGILEVDLDLGIWTPSMWYNPAFTDKTMDLLAEFEAAEPMRTWVRVMQENGSIVIPDIEKVKETAPREYNVYKRVGASSVLAAPFKPRPIGFLVLRNPTKYVQHTSMLQNLAYVMLNAMNQMKMIESARTSLSPDAIENDKDIVVNLFDSLEIYTSQGVLREADFKSPKICRLLTYLILHRKSIHPALDIVEALWPEEDADPDAQINSLRGLIYRFRQTFSLVSEHQLIETTLNGYRLNPNLRIITDLQQFDRCCDAVQSTLSLVRKVELLKQALSIYRGAVYKKASSEPWLVKTATHYSLRYIGVVNELLAKLAEAEDYAGIHQYATHALDIEPGNVKARYWLIYAMYNMSTIELAKSELERAKVDLTSEEYEELIDLLKEMRATW